MTCETLFFRFQWEIVPKLRKNGDGSPCLHRYSAGFHYVHMAQPTKSDKIPPLKNTSHPTEPFDVKNNFTNYES